MTRLIVITVTLLAALITSILITSLGRDSQLHVPAADYRRDWVLLGSFSVRADDAEQGAKELHVVYAAPATVDAYRRTGAFPAGATLIKDVFATKTEALTTGLASYAGALKGRFVMVKDSASGHGGESPLWGDGWGWAFYAGEQTEKTITTDYRKDCLGCHEPARAQDLIYVQGYPVLKR
ncbi:MAG: cytochrome P460 family protein [Hyphomicrobiales bacterium]